MKVGKSGAGQDGGHMARQQRLSCTATLLRNYCLDEKDRMVLPQGHQSCHQSVRFKFIYFTLCPDDKPSLSGLSRIVPSTPYRNRTSIAFCNRMLIQMKQHARLGPICHTVVGTRCCRCRRKRFIGFLYSVGQNLIRVPSQRWGPCRCTDLARLRLTAVCRCIRERMSKCQNITYQKRQESNLQSPT